MWIAIEYSYKLGQKYEYKFLVRTRLICRDSHIIDTMVTCMVLRRLYATEDRGEDENQ